MEDRKQVPGYPNYYVEPEGRVFSIRKNGYLTPFKSSRGVLTVQLVTPIGISKQVQIHKLVGLLYLPNPDNYRHLVHKDGDKHNNDISNLEWKTVHTSKVNKLKKAQRVVKRPNLSKEQIDTILRLLGEGLTQGEVAKRLGKAVSTISGVKRRNLIKEDKGLPIANFPGYYIDKEGKVYSEHKNGYLKPHKTSKQWSVTLFKKNDKGEEVRKVVLIKRLVAEAYIDNPDNLPCVINIDGDSNNNSLDNLKWVDKRTLDLFNYHQ